MECLGFETRKVISHAGSFKAISKAKVDEVFVSNFTVVCCYVQTRYLEVLNSHWRFKCLGFEFRCYVSGILKENLEDFFFSETLQAVNLKPT